MYYINFLLSYLPSNAGRHSNLLHVVDWGCLLYVEHQLQLFYTDAIFVLINLLEVCWYQVAACENAYFKMDNVLIDERRIHVDFSQSVAKVRWKGKGNMPHSFGVACTVNSDVRVELSYGAAITWD